MHIPKTAGTSLRLALIEALEPVEIAVGLDGCTLGGLKDFAAFANSRQGLIYKSADEIPKNADLISGHISASTLKDAFPNARLMTVLREPSSRALSFWLYWRSLSDDALDSWGPDWTQQVMLSRNTFLEFLREKSLACNNDNPTLRMLLWPSKLIPKDNFIDDALDEDLIEQATAVLSTFEFVDFIENQRFSENLQDWLQRPLTLKRHNETKEMPDHLKTPITSQISKEALHELERRSRLDLRLWSSVAGEVIGFDRLDEFRRNHLTSLIAHYERTLMTGAEFGGFNSQHRQI